MASQALQRGNCTLIFHQLWLTSWSIQSTNNMLWNRPSVFLSMCFHQANKAKIIVPIILFSNCTVSMEKPTWWVLPKPHALQIVMNYCDGILLLLQVHLSRVLIDRVNFLYGSLRTQNSAESQTWVMGCQSFSLKYFSVPQQKCLPFKKNHFKYST